MQGPQSQPIQPVSPPPVPTPRRSNRANPGWHEYFLPYLNAFAQYGVLNRDILTVITGHTPTTARTALHDMCKAGYVQFHWVGKDVLYYLTSSGADMCEHANYARSARSAFGLARHDAAVNRVITNSIRMSDPPSIGLVKWLGPRLAREDFTLYSGPYPTQRSQQLDFQPDAHLEYLIQLADGRTGLYPITLELDMGSEPLSHLVRKLENGIAAISQRPNGADHNLLWVFIDSEKRHRHFIEEAKARIEALRPTIPAKKFPRVLVSTIASKELAKTGIPTKALLIETGEESGWAGYLTEKYGMEEFVGVNPAFDVINQRHVVRTQIKALLEREDK